MARIHDDLVAVQAGPITLEGSLMVPRDAMGLVVFVHGSGSSRFSPRNQQVAEHLRNARFGTLLFDLLTPDEESIDNRTRALRFDIDLLSRRVVNTIDWLVDHPDTRDLPIGLFGASTGAAAALVAAGERPRDVRCVVSRGGRPDLAGEGLTRVEAPTMLIVGEHDPTVIDLNRHAMHRLRNVEIEIVPRATHLFEEPGALERVVELATDFFKLHLPSLQGV